MSIKDLFKTNKPKENNGETIVVNKEDLMSMFKEMMEKQPAPVETDAPVEVPKEEPVKEIKPEIPPIPPIIPNPMPPATPIEVPKEEINYIPDPVQFIGDVYENVLSDTKKFKEPQPIMPLPMIIYSLRLNGLTNEQIVEAVKAGHIDKIGDI